MQDTHTVTIEADNLLPEDWRIVQLGQLGAVSGGSTPSTKVSKYWDGDIAWATPSDVTKCTDIYISDTGRKITKAGLENSATKLLPSGAVLMTSRATIGEVVINRIPMATNQGFINVVCDPRIAHNEYLAFWMRQNKQVFEDRAHGVTFREISKANFKEIPITLPPLPEQRAIARALHTVQAAREARRRAAALERERKAALMQTLFTKGARGEPTKMTEIGEIPVRWGVVRLGDYCDKPDYGFTESAIQEPIGPKFLRITDIQDGGVNWATVPWCKSDPATTERYGLRVGDIVVARIGATTGKTFLIEECPETIFASYLIRIRTSASLDPSFLNYFCQTPKYWGHIDQFKGDRLKGGVNIPILQGLQVPFPSIEEQRAIAEVLRACDEQIAALEREAAAHDELFRALLEELMTGRLRATELIESL